MGVLIGRFHAFHPGVTIHVEVGFPDSLVRMVAEDQLDLAFITSPNEPCAGVDITPLSTYPMVLACPMGRRLALSPGVTIEDLTDEDFVDFTPALSARQATDDAFGRAGIGRRIRATCDEIASLLELASQGMGLAIVPRPLATATRVPVAIVPIEDTTLVWTVAAAGKTGGPTTESGRALWAALAEITMR